MAKLSAHGPELARMEKVETKEDGTVVRHVFALMTDGARLSKFTIKHPGERLTDYGWGLSARGDKNPTPAVLPFVEHYRALGYERTGA